MLRRQRGGANREPQANRYPGGSPQFVQELLGDTACQIRDAILPLTVELAGAFPETGVGVHNQDPGNVHLFLVDKVPAIVLGEGSRSGVVPYTVLLMPEVGLAACPPVTAYDPDTNFRVEVPGLESATVSDDLWLAYGQNAAEQLDLLRHAAFTTGADPNSMPSSQA